jgi:hypothetical protein
MATLQNTCRKVFLPVDVLLVEVFTHFPQIDLVVLFGSVVPLAMQKRSMRGSKPPAAGT